MKRRTHLKGSWMVVGRSFLVMLVGVGCSGSADDGPTGAGLGGPDIPLQPVAEDLFTVGALEGADWEVFGQISFVAFDESGNLNIMDRDASRITVVGPDGVFLRTVGKRGGGPGEFQMAFAAAPLPNGGLAVFDLGKQGFEVFDPSGAYVRSVPVDLTQGGPGQRMAALPDGRIVSAGGFRLFGGGGPPDPAAMPGTGDTRPVDRFSLDDGGHDVLYGAWQMPAAPEGDAETLEGAGGSQITFTMASRAFEPELHFGVLSDGRVALVDSIGYRVKIIDGAGQVTGTLERPILPIEVSVGVREAEKARRLAALEDQGGGRLMVLGGGPGMQIDQDQVREMMVDQVQGLLFADEVPVLSSLAVDRADRLWLGRFGPDGEAEGPTDVVGAEGTYFGTVARRAFPTPDAFGPDNLIAYIESDDLGVQRVRVARLAPM